MSLKLSKIVSLMLLVSLLSSLAACQDNVDNTGDITTGSNTDDVTAPEEIELTSGVPDDVDLGGATIIMLNAPQYENFLTLMNSMEETGDTVNDAVYRRNLAVMEKLNVNLEFNDLGSEGVKADYIRRTVSAGDSEFDFVVGTQWEIVPVVTEGMFRDIIDLEYVDISQPWWAEEYINKVNFGEDKRFFIAGDISVEFIRDLGCVYYNKTVYENYFGNRDELYDVVLDGGWTLDYVYEITKDAYADLNQNNTHDEEDQYGYLVIYNIATDHMYYASGATTITLRDNLPVLDVSNEHNISVAEKIYDLYYQNEAAYVVGGGIEYTEGIIPTKFANDNLMLMFGLLYYSDYLRDMKSDYGILPTPKYDESQEDYMTLVHDGAPLTAIPMTTSDDKLDSVAAVIEEMAYQGYMMVTPEYYNVVLKQKYARDSSDKAMMILDMIRENTFTDAGYVYNYAIDGAGLLIRDLMSTKQSNLATLWAAKESSANAKLDALIEAYTELE